MNHLFSENIKELFSVLPRTGILPSDDEIIKLRKIFLNSMALLMSSGGLLWGGICLYFQLYFPAIIPLSYTVLTGVNLFYFHLSKNFRIVRFIQVLMSLLLPFFFQWSLGGLLSSGAVMFWAFLALVGSMSFQDTSRSVYWLLLYILLVIISGVFENNFRVFSVSLSSDIEILFFTINFVVISAIIFSLMLYYIKSKNKASLELKLLAQTLENRVVERTHELNQALENLKNQKNIIEKKNKDITDSINYAQRIQAAILENNRESCEILKDYFIFFKPKDIVSGDFYWFHCDKEKNLFYIAIVDCTGHGVPGAFMSLIADSLLNQTIVEKKVTEPSFILHEIDRGVHNSLKLRQSKQYDGMDMALAVINKSSKQIMFSGAKNPLVVVKDADFNIYKGSQFPIGGILERTNKDFKTEAISIEFGTKIYMFSDGFYDQIGENIRKKYQKHNFFEYLQKISAVSIHEQHNLLEKEFLTWKGADKQTDDVLVFGLCFTENNLFYETKMNYPEIYNSIF